MRKPLMLVTVLALAFGATTATWAGTAAASDHTRAPSSRGSRASSAIVVDWNQELLRIVRTPGAQPATVHPTRNFAILQAAIYDAVVSITHDAPPYLFTVRAADDARPDATAATAGHDVLAGLYPAMKPELDQLLMTELSALPRGAGTQRGAQVGALISELMLGVRRRRLECDATVASPGDPARTVPPDATQLRPRGLHALGRSDTVRAEQRRAVPARPASDAVEPCVCRGDQRGQGLPDRIRAPHVPPTRRPKPCSGALRIWNYWNQISR